MGYGILQFALALPFSLRQRRLLTQRPAMDENKFVRQVSGAGGDEAAATLIWVELLDWVYVSGFTPYPDDKLGQVYGMGEEELDEDLVLAIFRRLDIEPPSAESLGIFGQIDTPIRIAQLIRQCRHKQ